MIEQIVLDSLKLALRKSTCLKHPTAIVIETKSNDYLMGYNGAPYKAEKCNPCPREGLATGAATNSCRAIHAERRAIYEAGRKGIPLENATMYIRRFPCAECAKSIVESGISKLVASTDFWNYQKNSVYNFELAEQLLKQCKIEVVLSKEMDAITCDVHNSKPKLA